MSYSPIGHWLVVAVGSDDFYRINWSLFNTGRQHLEINDFYDIVSHLIFPEGSHGRLGVKVQVCL
jgi:hypothetical protein